MREISLLLRILLDQKCPQESSNSSQVVFILGREHFLRTENVSSELEHDTRPGSIKNVSSSIPFQLKKEAEICLPKWEI